MRAKPRKPIDPLLLEYRAALLEALRELHDPYSVVGGYLANRRVRRALEALGQ